MSGVEIFRDLEQGSEEWHAARCGVATASRFSDIMTKPREKGARWSKTALTYAYEIAGEIITGRPHPFVETWDMRRGKEREPIVRRGYEYITDTKVEQVGFIRRGRAGYSPDGLVGAEGAIEIKSHKPHILIPMILGIETPEQHVAQTQGGLWVSGREWIELVGEWEGLPLYRHKVTRDEAYIDELARSIAAFGELVDEIVDRVRHYGEFGPVEKMAAE